MDPIRFYGLEIPNESEEKNEIAGDDPDDEDYEPSRNYMGRRNIIIYPSDSDEESLSDEDEQASVDPLDAGPSRSRTIRKNSKLKQDICFGETLIISCGHRDGDYDDRSSESEWTCSESTSTEISEKVTEHKISIVDDTVENEIKGEAEDEEDDFQFFFFPDCKKPAPAQHSQSSIVIVDGLPKINLDKTVHTYCTCKRGKKGECECFTKLPCLCGAKLKADCVCRELKNICTCGLSDPSPKCTCAKAAVCSCDPDGKIIPVCVCDDIEKPCFCNMPNVFPSPVCKCKCKPKDLKNTNVPSGDESISSMEAIEGESNEFTIKEQCRKELCDCQKPEPKKLCYCKKGKDCICRIACICGVQNTCMCEPTDSEDIPCKDAEHKSICSCDLPKICDCNSSSDIVCDCFPPKICTCGDPEHCKCFAICTCQKPCLCDVVSTKEKVCTCFHTPTGLSEIVCTCPKPENKNLKRVRAGKHGYRWCNEVDPHHTYFDFAYGRHKNLEKKESEPEKFVIQGLHDEKEQDECPIYGAEPPKYEKKVRKPSLDCCSAVGGISISVETLGEDKDKFLVQVVSHSSKEGAKTGSKLVSIVDCNLHTLEENRTEHITKKRLTKEKRSYMAICENGYYNKVTRICGDKHVIRRIYHTFEKAHDFLLEGANVIIMRYLAINRYKGHIKTDTVMMDGLICQSVYVSHGVSEAIVNGTPLQVLKLERHIIEPSGFVHQTLTVFTLRGYMVSHEWADSCYILHVNPLLRINTTKDEIEPHAPLREKWRDDLQLLSDYLDFKTVRTSEGGRYITESGALTSVVRDYLQAILLLRPQDTLNFTRHYFGTVLSSLDLPHEDYFDPASRHVRYHFFEE